jgi:hypothetical protein
MAFVHSLNLTLGPATLHEPENEPLYSGLACSSCNPSASLDVHGLKGFLPLFDVKTDRIHHTVSAAKGVCHRPVVVDVGADRSKFRIITAKQVVTPVRMP